MLQTVQDLYEATLDGLKKEKAGTIPPSKWNPLINHAQDVWRKEKRKMVDIDSKTISDLEPVKVITSLFDVTDNKFEKENPDGNATYASIWFISDIFFTVDNNNGSPDYSDGDSLLPISGRLIKAGQKHLSERNPYKQSDHENVNYIESGKYVIALPKSNYNVQQCTLIYFRYPATIVYDPDVPGNNVSCDFNEDQRREIVDTAVRIYLERIKEERYQSFLVEEQLKE